MGNFEDVNIYLKSIKTYLYNIDEFNWNYGISLASVGEYKDAEECFTVIQSEKYTRVLKNRFREDYCYISWLTRCYIMNGKPNLAWELYSKMDNSHESISLLTLIANECYRVSSILNNRWANFSILLKHSIL